MRKNQKEQGLRINLGAEDSTFEVKRGMITPLFLILNRRGEPCPRHLRNSCGCWLPPLTNLATLQCGEARQVCILPYLLVLGFEF
jgi:hypothetical protein